MQPAALGLLFALSGLVRSAHAQTPSDEAQIKAAYVYNFLKFVDWPSVASQRSDDPLVVVLIGDGPTIDAIERFLSAKQVGDRHISVRRQRWDQSLAGVQALFVDDGDARQLRRVFAAAAAASTLSIGDADDFAAQGGVIGLLIEGRKVRFDINTAAAEASRLHISSKLLALGRTVLSTKAAVGESP